MLNFEGSIKLVITLSIFIVLKRDLLLNAMALFMTPTRLGSTIKRAMPI